MMRRLNSLFGTSPELKSLSLRAGEIYSLQKTWEAVAPPPLNKLSHVGPLHHGTLTIFTHSNAVAAKLKMQVAGLQKKLMNQGLEVTSIRVEVQVTSYPRTTPRAIKKPGREAARKMLDFAENLPDSPLKSSLKRLAGKA